MAKRDIDDLYGERPGDPGPPGPLFAAEWADNVMRGMLGGPFARSKMEPSFDERWIADLLWSCARGRGNPVSIAQIIEDGKRLRYGQGGALLNRGATALDERWVKKTIEKLRRDHHMPIGALRTKPSGYFIVVDDEDARVALKAFTAQLFTSLRTWRAMMSKQFRMELAGQLRTELEVGDE